MDVPSAVPLAVAHGHLGGSCGAATLMRPRCSRTVTVPTARWSRVLHLHHGLCDADRSSTVDTAVARHTPSGRRQAAARRLALRTGAKRPIANVGASFSSCFSVPSSERRVTSYAPGTACARPVPERDRASALRRQGKERVWDLSMKVRLEDVSAIPTSPGPASLGNGIASGSEARMSLVYSGKVDALPGAPAHPSARSSWAMDG